MFNKLNRLIACILSVLFTLPHAVAQTSGNTVQGREGNTYTFKTMADNKNWMTTNLNTNIPGSYCYENEKQNCNQYGRLYNWEAAQQGCLQLGEGWRLPTNEEWKQMVGYYGGVRGDSKDSGKTAYQALKHDGAAGFNISYGGTRDANGTFRRQNGHGFYWTASESDSTQAWFYNFGINGKIVNRHSDGDKKSAFSVRCIQEARKPNEK